MQYGNQEIAHHEGLISNSLKHSLGIQLDSLLSS